MLPENKLYYSNPKGIQDLLTPLLNLKYLDLSDIEELHGRSETCKSPAKVKGTRIVDFTPHWIDCDNNQIHLAIILAVIVVCIGITAALLIYFRWDIRFSIALYKAQKKVKDQDAENEDVVPLQGRYDAFISYTYEDLGWVRNELIPNVEEGEDIRFQLCISDRDFLPGAAIVDNIQENLDKSRKAIFLITQNFLNSEWQTFELNMSQVKLFDDRKDMIILVLLEKIHRDDLPKSLRALMRHVPHLEWPEKEHKRRVFWKKLKLLLMVKNDKQHVPLHAN